MENRKNSTQGFPQPVERNNAHLWRKSEKVCKIKKFFQINVENDVENVDKKF